MQAARHDRVSIGELTARLIGGQVDHQTQSTVDRHRFLNAARSRRPSFPPEEDGVGTSEHNQTSAEMDGRTHQTAIEGCQKQSNSAWLHFPHIELLFLLFAFEGAVASEASEIREAFDAGQPSWLTYCAILALVRTAAGTVNINLRDIYDSVYVLL